MLSFSGKWLVTSSLLFLHNLVWLVMTSLRNAAAQTLVTFEYSPDEVAAPNFHTHKKHCVMRKTVFEFGSQSTLASSFGCQDLNCNRFFVFNRWSGVF